MLARTSPERRTRETTASGLVTSQRQQINWTRTHEEGMRGAYTPGIPVRSSYLRDGTCASRGASLSEEPVCSEDRASHWRAPTSASRSAMAPSTNQCADSPGTSRANKAPHVANATIAPSKTTCTATSGRRSRTGSLGAKSGAARRAVPVVVDVRSGHGSDHACEGLTPLSSSQGPSDTPTFV